MSVLSSANTLTLHHWRVAFTVPRQAFRPAAAYDHGSPPGHDGLPIRAGPTHDHCLKDDALRQSPVYSVGLIGVVESPQGE